jgi:TATA-box binding protein (TBP) (component of TFIID and TFIIIB)
MEIKPYRISTITGIASLNQKINLKILYDNIDEYIKPVSKEIRAKLKLSKKEREKEMKEEEERKTIEGQNEEKSEEQIDKNIILDENELCQNKSKIESEIFYVEYGSTKNVLQYKGENIKKKRKKNIESNPNTDNLNEVEYKIKRFDNQATLFINHKGKYINLKVFKNGNLQMTGLQGIDDGKCIADICINIIKEIYHNKDKNIIENYEHLQNTNYSVILINSDFKVNIYIKRSILNSILINNYGNISSFESCIYQGVKLQYYCNTYMENHKHNGNCHCFNGNKLCNGKGKGNNEGDCKKITICIFQSGCIIITGSQKIEQLEECYNYIVNVIRENFNDVKLKMIENF